MSTYIFIFNAVQTLRIACSPCSRWMRTILSTARNRELQRVWLGRKNCSLRSRSTVSWAMVDLLVLFKKSMTFCKSRPRQLLVCFVGSPSCSSGINCGYKIEWLFILEMSLKVIWWIFMLVTVSLLCHKGASPPQWDRRGAVGSPISSSVWQKREKETHHLLTVSSFLCPLQDNIIICTLATHLGPVTSTSQCSSVPLQWGVVYPVTGDT